MTKDYPTTNNFDISIENDIAIVTLSGDTLDASNCYSFREKIQPILEQEKKLIFNMEHIQFIDSSGCGTLNICFKKSKLNQGKIVICCLTPQVQFIFRLIKLNRILECFDTLEQAINAYLIS